MGRASRLRKALHAGQRQVDVTDAARVIRLMVQLAQTDDGTVAAFTNPDNLWMLREAARAHTRAWQASPVAVRPDADFVAALADTDGSSALTSDWIDRVPFDSFAVALPTPIRSVTDGATHEWYGFLCSGIGAEVGPGQPGRIPIAGSAGIASMWVFRELGSGMLGAMALEVGMPRHAPPRWSTIGEAVEYLQHQTIARPELVYSVDGVRSEMSRLVPLTLLLPMYLASVDPDLQRVPRERTTSPSALTGASIVNVGWQIGSALRVHAHQEAAESQATGPAGHGGTRAPHIRRAHWTRVRIAERDEAGAVVGSRTGVQGLDWHYESRWIPPIPVNVHRGELAPVVRRVAG